MDTRMIGSGGAGNYRGRSANYMLGIFGKPQRENTRTASAPSIRPCCRPFTPGTIPRCSRSFARGGWLDELRREHEIIR